MFSVKFATTFSEGLYRAEDGCARGYDADYRVQADGGIWVNAKC